jgi:hypothetical protein
VLAFEAGRKYGVRVNTIRCEKPLRHIQATPQESIPDPSLVFMRRSYSSHALVFTSFSIGL